MRDAYQIHVLPFCQHPLAHRSLDLSRHCGGVAARTPASFATVANDDKMDGLASGSDDFVGGDGGRDDAGGASVSDSPELVCCACGITSKKSDPVGVKKKITKPPLVARLA